MEHTLRDIILHYHPSTTDENSITFETPYFDQIVGEIKNRAIENIEVSNLSNKRNYKKQKHIEPKIKFKNDGNQHLLIHLDWYHPSTDKITTKIKRSCQFRHQLLF